MKVTVENDLKTNSTNIVSNNVYQTFIYPFICGTIYDEDEKLDQRAELQISLNEILNDREDGLEKELHSITAHYDGIYTYYTIVMKITNCGIDEKGNTYKLDNC